MATKMDVGMLPSRVRLDVIQSEAANNLATFCSYSVAEPIVGPEEFWLDRYG